MSNKWIIKDSEGNITNPCILADEDFVKANFTHYEAVVAPTPSTLTESEKSRMWRDSELASTDNTPSDHSQYDAIMAYRVSLRSWPSQESFPTTKPTLGS
jgi:hypothetical protein